MSAEGRAKLWAKAAAEAPPTFKAARAPRAPRIERRRAELFKCSACINLIKVKHAAKGETLCIVCRRARFPSYQSRTQHLIQREFNAIMAAHPVEMFPDRKVIFDSGWYEHRPGDPLPLIESFRIRQ